MSTLTSTFVTAFEAVAVGAVGWRGGGQCGTGIAGWYGFQAVPESLCAVFEFDVVAAAYVFGAVSRPGSGD